MVQKTESPFLGWQGVVGKQGQVVGSESSAALWATVVPHIHHPALQQPSRLPATRGHQANGVHWSKSSMACDLGQSPVEGTLVWGTKGVEAGACASCMEGLPLCHLEQAFSARGRPLALSVAIPAMSGKCLGQAPLALQSCGSESPPGSWQAEAAGSSTKA